MRIALYILIALAVLVLAAMAYVRLTPITASDGVGRPSAQGPGDYPSTGGFYAVRPAGEIDLAALDAVILASPRASKLEEGIYLTRSAIWAFPDITHVWEEGGNIHIATHLVYGSSDMGANRARVEAWLAALP